MAGLRVEVPTDYDERLWWLTALLRPDDLTAYAKWRQLRQSNASKQRDKLNGEARLGIATRRTSSPAHGRMASR